MDITTFFLDLATISFVNDASSKLFLLFSDWHFNSTVFPLPSSDFTGIGASYIILHHLVMENGEKGILSRNLVSNEKEYVSI